MRIVLEQILVSSLSLKCVLRLIVSFSSRSTKFRVGDWWMRMRISIMINLLTINEHEHIPFVNGSHAHILMDYLPHMRQGPRVAIIVWTSLKAPAKY